MNRRTRQLVYGLELLVLGTLLLWVVIRQEPYSPPTPVHFIAFGLIFSGLVIGGISAFVRDA